MKKVLCLLLCFMLLCGCAPAEETVPETADTPAAVEPETAAPAEEPEEVVYDPVVFSTTDLAGNPWTEADLAGAVTILNFWEYWCGPCVSEMPALQKLYEEYADEGLQVIGIFSDASDLESVKSVVESTGVTYPILYYSDDFAPFQTGYVPTTVFLDGEGRPVAGVVGAYEYEQWVQMLEEIW